MNWTVKRGWAAASSLTAVATVAAFAGVASLGAASGATTPVAQATGPDRCDQPGPYALPHGDDRVDLDPADFTTHVDNTYWPMRPGTRWVYNEDEGGSRLHVIVEVTHRTRTIRGIEARVVHDVVTEQGELVEDTLDWYSQDSGGSIWYLGERTREYDNGHVSTAGSFEYGKDGAQAGVIVPGKPRAGCSYRQEYLAGEAEDRGQVLSRRDDVKVGGTRFRDVLSTSDSIALEPFVLEHKFLARGVGPVLTIGVSPEQAREELVRVTGLGR